MISKDDVDVVMAVQLASRDYAVVLAQEIQANGTLAYVASNPELEGLESQGATQFEALKNLRDARINYILRLIQSGLKVPHPSPTGPRKTIFRLT